MATSTSIREAPNASAAPGAILKEFAVRFRQKRPDVNLYVTALPLKTLLGRFQADTYRADNRRGYQRAVTPSRLRQISSYMREEEGMLPTSSVSRTAWTSSRRSGPTAAARPACCASALTFRSGSSTASTASTASSGRSSTTMPSGSRNTRFLS